MVLPNVLSLVGYYLEKLFCDGFSVCLYVLIHFLSVPLAVVTSAIILFIPYVRWFIILYLIWVVYDRKTCERGGRPLGIFRRLFVLTWYRNYFPIKSTTLDGVWLDANKNYLFCGYPHGRCTGFGSTAMFGDGFMAMFPDHQSYMVSLTSLFYVPFVRDVYMALGNISSSFESIDYVLRDDRQGSIVGLLVGGVEEMLYARPGYYKIVLKNRKGFIKVALVNGSPIVPVFSFGEVDQVVTRDFPLWRIVQNFLRVTMGIPLTLPKNFIPIRKPITTVVGHPIEIEKVERPTTEQIEELHAKFTTELVKLFESEKHKYVENPEETFLEIV